MNEPLPLRDIHLPAAVDWFPPAPGWWLLPLLLLALIALWRWFRGHRRSVRIDKGARLEVEALLQRFERDSDAQRLLRDLSALFKRIGMTYLSRPQVAALSGLAWIEQVDGLAGGRRFSPQVRELLASAPYQAHVGADDSLLAELVNQVRRWSADLPSRRGSGRHV
jgi:hypothetical protein